MVHFLQRKGFTLIELLVVIVILGILAGVVLLAINPLQQIQRGRDLRRKSDISAIQTYLEQYRHDQSAYPLPANIISYPNTLNTVSCPTSSSLAANGITYMSQIPCDPLGSSATYNGGNYYYNSNGSTYTLEACLEFSGDPDGQTTDPSGLGSSTTCPSGTYYVVTNQ